METISYIEKIDSTMHLSITIGIGLLVFILMIWLLIITIKNNKLRIKYEKYIKNPDGKTINNKIDYYFQKFNNQNNIIKELKDQVINLRNKNENNFCKIGFLRFNAFTEVGADLSFVVALMDSKNNGIILTSIYGRDDNRIYAKTIENGSSPYRLSEEEKLAIKKAME